MTEGEFIAAGASGAITSSEGDGEEAAAPSTTSSDSISQFIPLLTQLESVQLCVSVAPTYIPQSFQDQIVFVFDGSNYFLYLYFNNQWNEFAVSGGGGSGVDSVLAGSGISLSGSTGNVTITCTIDDATLPMSNITTNDVSITQHGFAPKAPNDATKFLDGTGAYSVPSSSGGGMQTATGTNTLTGATVPVSQTNTITHGLGIAPKLISVIIPQLLAPTAFGTGTNYDASQGWIYLNGSGTAIGGLTVTYHVIAGGGGSSTLEGANTGQTSVSSGSTTSGGNGTASITINNVTSTTFDIVYAAAITLGTGSTTFSFPTVTWQVFG